MSGSTSGRRGSCALGLAAGSRTPVAVVTTSGTAVGNLLPAVMEASHSGRRLVVLAADRPAAMRGSGANQTTRQDGIFGVFAPCFDLGVDASSEELAAAAEVATRRRGPTHLNVQLEEPLLPESEPWWPPGRLLRHLHRHLLARPTSPHVMTFGGHFGLRPRYVITCGELAGAEVGADVGARRGRGVEAPAGGGGGGAPAREAHGRGRGRRRRLGGPGPRRARRLATARGADVRGAGRSQRDPDLPAAPGRPARRRGRARRRPRPPDPLPPGDPPHLEPGRRGPRRPRTRRGGHRPGPGGAPPRRPPHRRRRRAHRGRHRLARGVARRRPRPLGATRPPRRRPARARRPPRRARGRRVGRPLRHPRRRLVEPRPRPRPHDHAVPPARAPVRRREPWAWPASTAPSRPPSGSPSAAATRPAPWPCSAT